MIEKCGCEDVKTLGQLSASWKGQILSKRSIVTNDCAYLISMSALLTFWSIVSLRNLWFPNCSLLYNKSISAYNCSRIDVPAFVVLSKWSFKKSRFYSYATISRSTISSVIEEMSNAESETSWIWNYFPTGFQVHYKSSCNSYDVRACMASCG